MILYRNIFRNRYLVIAWLLIIFFLIYSTILAFGSLEGAPQSRTGNPFFPYLSDKPLTEDGYYMLTVAWNIAEGDGFTYNNHIKTTGVQPLATLLYSFVSKLVQSFGGNKYDFARAVLILAALLQVLFSFLIYKISLTISNNPEKDLYFLLSTCVVLLNFKVLLNFANGLETGIYLILLSAYFLYWLSYAVPLQNSKHVLLIGILSGLLLLCRLDSAIILTCFMLLLFLKKKIKISQLISIAFIASLLYLPWQLYILDVTGNILQSSARSQTGLFLFFDLPNKFEQYFTSILQHLTPFLFTGNLLAWLMIPLGLLYLALFYIVHRKFNLGPVFASSGKILRMILISFLVLIIIYFFFSSASYFYIRYLAFIMVISFPVFVVVSAELYKKFRKVSIASFLLIFAVFLLQAMLYLHSGKSISVFSTRAGFVKNNFSNDVRVAAYQTGVLGYFFEDVINLDGKMDNSALQSLSKGGIENYIDSMKVDVIMEWKRLIPYLFSKDYLETNWQIYNEDIGDGKTICYVRKKL